MTECGRAIGVIGTLAKVMVGFGPIGFPAIVFAHLTGAGGGSLDDHAPR